MAYTASVVTHTIARRRVCTVTVSETAATSTSEWQATIPFAVATLVKYQATLTSGSGATLNPKLGKAVGWTASSQNDIGTNAATAAHIKDESRVVIDFGGSGATLYGVSQVNAGSDNAISTTLVLVEGVWP